MFVGGREEEEEAEAEEEPGIQNQKQEPHTKMWGIKHAETRRKPTEASASTEQIQTCRSTRKEAICWKDRIFACK